MTKQHTFAKRLTGMLALLMVFTLLIGALMTAVGGTEEASSVIRLLEGELITNRDSFFSSSAVQKLPDGVKDTDTISLIIELKNKENLLDAYDASGSKLSLAEYATSSAAAAIRAEIAAEKREMLALLDAAGVKYGTGADYDTIISGFEVTVKAADFKTVCTTFADRANTIVGEVYNAAKTELVENKVNVYDTGIFNSAGFGYDGTGTTVAVLDTGLDYYHTAFSTSNFTADRNKLGLTFDMVASLIDKTAASGMQAGLTASDVYISEKVPFGFDYADGDSDVFPINSDHGTHVAGVIAGKDDTITGVAPNAQLVIMKTFSDIKQTALTSWIIAALEDCVTLGVDVINMSLGTSCGFSRESDEKEIASKVYDRIRERGISLIVAASNSFNSTYGSEKNGNLGLTSNPDSGTVGSPGTYAGALSVASIKGAKTPYILFNGEIIYFEESTDRVSEEKNFVDELLGEGVNEVEIEYITIPGAGRSADYAGVDVSGKIVLVRRGDTTFEEKANTAQQKGAAGIIVYNNVSGDIKMNVGDTTIPVCSIAQDHGEEMAAAGIGKIKISRDQTSGPFISDFSSWGPTPDLQLKPEITAHGGSILSAVPGQSYDRLSGTSMATPNVSGLTALLRQYVKANFKDIANDPVAVNTMVYRLMMSTADITMNKQNIPYAVRKQGAGLANLANAAATKAFIMTYNRVTGSEMNTSKIELGDDPTKTGVYTLKFSINNFGSATLSYDLSAYVMTEGVSDTKTSHGETTVTEEGYLLGADVAVTAVNNATLSGTTVSVAGGAVADVTVTVTLTDADRKYLDESFANGMYIEGFVVLKAKDQGSVDLSVPYLGFYGDWTKAPMFDLDFYATNKDELDDAIDVEDKTLPDAYATRPIGGLADDYVSYLGSYYFLQDPTATKISADRKYISISNQEDTVNSLRFVWAGLLRNAKRVEITITEDSTGEVIFTAVDENIRKSYGDGGSIYPANIDIEFSAIEENLKNNTAYTVKLQGYLDYGDGGLTTNENNTFTFPLVTDFEAPAVTDCEFYTEYDRTTKKTRLFARVAVYDNHYSMCMQMGYVGMSMDGTAYEMHTFGQYLTPVFCEKNSTAYVTYELTDYVNEIRQNAIHANTFAVVCYDYALNQACYEIPLPDDFADFYFEEAAEGLTMSPNEVYTLVPKIHPGNEWPELLEYESLNKKVATVVNNKVVAIAPGVARIVARDPVTKKNATFLLTVLSEGDPGYVRYDKPVADVFTLTGYYTNKAYYQLAAEDRTLGEIGDERKFTNDAYCSLEMYPSEAVTVRYRLDAYFPDVTKVTFKSSNDKVVTVDATGKITAVAEGYASISVKVQMDGKDTFYSKSISIEVKDPFINQAGRLTHYFGLGGIVRIPEKLFLTAIDQFAFSNYDYVAKEDYEITEEEPDKSKMWFIGDNTIEEVIIPEGVEKIGAYAFANLTALKRVVLPKSLKMIDYGAFYGCVSLEKVEGIENVLFINQNAFASCNLQGTLDLKSAIAVADYAFIGNRNLAGIKLSESTQSVGAYAFAGCEKVTTLTVAAEKIKLGQYAFSDCRSLSEVSINAAVIPAGLFSECTALTRVTLGRDVAVIGEFAFRGTGVHTLTLAAGNTNLKMSADGKYITNMAGDTLVLGLPTLTELVITDGKITTIGVGALSGNRRLQRVEIPSAATVSNYAFADCEKLSAVVLKEKLALIGDYAFAGVGLTTFDLPGCGLSEIGRYAFMGSALTSVTVPAGMTVGEGAFSECLSLAKVTVGDNAVLGEYAFFLRNFEGKNYLDEDGVRYYYYIYTSPLKELVIGENVKIGNSAFFGAAELESVTLGAGAVLGDQAFYNAVMLKNIDLSHVLSIGDRAFSGDVLMEYTNSDLTLPAVVNNSYVYRYYAPKLESVTLTDADKLGDQAFAFCLDLVRVTLGDKITVVPANAFFNCTALAEINLGKVVYVGDEAFRDTALSVIDLSAIESIGKYAFFDCENLTNVTLNPAGCEIGEAVFSNCTALSLVENLNKVTVFGDYAFAYTALTSVDLSCATEIGTWAFIKEYPTPFTVILGENENLVKIGDNPFAMCLLAPFESVTYEEFNGVKYEIPTGNFSISKTVVVIDGSLYRVVPKGYEMITYTGEGESAVVADDTVRISAMTFAGTPVVKVVLPHTVAAIGHKAFYGCEGLAMVSFSSYVAPRLEEEYDVFYFVTGDNTPATGDYEYPNPDGGENIKKPGLGIVDYFMWNVTDMPTNVYYGANFVDYIGHMDSHLLMVAPVNGQQYESFIYGQYFSARVEGAAAADELTLAAIAAINRLPEKVALSDKALVEAARLAYDKIASLEQQALVKNYTNLTRAEKRIADLEYLENEGAAGPNEPTDPTPAPAKKASAAVVLAIVFGVLFGLAAGAAAVFAVLYFKKEKAADFEAVTELPAREAPAAEAEEAAETDRAPAAEAEEAGVTDETPAVDETTENETAREASADEGKDADGKQS